MRIGIFHGSAAGPNPGGKAVFVRKMASQLAADHEVFLYTSRDDRTDGEVILDDRVQVVEFPRFDSRIAHRLLRATPLGTDQVFGLVGAVRSGVVEHIDEHVDVLLTHRVFEDLALSNLVSVPVVYQYHNVQSVGIAAKARERFANADAHVVNSVTIKREVDQKLGRQVDGIVSPGVDTTAFTPEAPPAFRTDEDVILFVGRVVPGKGVFELVRALERLGRDVRCVVAGHGDLDTVRSLARERGVSDSLSLPGAVPHDELPGYYAAATVFCNPTLYEGFGMVNLEAMACGTPVITSRLPGVCEYATHDENALLVEPGDVDGLATALDSLLADPARRERLAAAGLKAAQKHSWGVQADRLAEICARVVAAQQPPRREISAPQSR